MSTTAPPRPTRPAPPLPPAVQARRRYERMRLRRAVTLLLMALVVPGSAQLVDGSRRIGLIAVRTYAALLAITALVAWLVPLDTLLGLAVRPWVLSAYKVLAYAVATAWMLLLLDAWRRVPPPQLARRHRPVVLGVAVALCVAVGAPFVLSARYATAARDAVVALFPSGDAAVAADGRLNILLVGADAGKDREGLRPDSLNLVSIDVRTARPVVVSLPRNLQGARFPEGTAAAEKFPRGFSGEGDVSQWLLNATWTYAVDNPEVFPGPAGPGPTAVKQAVEGTLGVPVHHYVLVDMQGFRDLVDALGGISLTVTEPIPVGNSGRMLQPGRQRVDGKEALWFARSRDGGSDYDRMARQRCVIESVLREADPGTVLRNFQELAVTATAMLRTDIPQGLLPELLSLADQAKAQPLGSVQLVPPLVVPADPDFDVIRSTVTDALAGRFTHDSAADEPVPTRSPATRSEAPRGRVPSPASTPPHVSADVARACR